jgi:hypothetical protein
LDLLGVEWIAANDGHTYHAANVTVLEGLHNRLYARKNYLLAHTYLAQPQCEWYNKAESELQQLTKLLLSTETGSIQNTQNLGKEVEDGMMSNIISLVLALRTTIAHATDSQRLMKTSIES